MEPYQKPVLSYELQLQLLKDRGISIAHEPKALHSLKNISYYRLSAYMYPFLQDKASHQFKPNTNFENIIHLYDFDRRLRLLIMDEIERIEVAVRSQLIYVMSQSKGKFWFQDATLFFSYEQYLEALLQINKHKKESDEVFIKHFRQKYNDPLPPSWMAMEVISFGLLLRMYNNLNATAEKNLIAEHFGVKEKVFASWIHSLVYIRNICAHHGRLWNRELAIKPMMPKKVVSPWLNNTAVNLEKLYLPLCCIQYILQQINPHSSFKTHLKELLSTYPQIDVTAMGFPANWDAEHFWT